MPDDKRRRYVRAPSKEILRTVPRKIERQMTIRFQSFYLDIIFLALLADKIYTGVNEGIKKLLLYSLIF
jgi:hypothetical protein